MSRACDCCGKPIRSAVNASVFLDSCDIGGVLAHDLCVPEMLERPGRYRYVLLSHLERVGDASVPYSVNPSVASVLAHYEEKDWFTREHRRLIERAHIVADCLGADRRKSERERRGIPTSLRTRVLERDGFRCRRCGATADVAKLTMDHVIPVAKGGRTELSNLQTLCAPCNGGKSDHHPTARDLEVAR